MFEIHMVYSGLKLSKLNLISGRFLGVKRNDK